MATYTKETALYDTAAIAGDIQEAGTTASKYIAADSTGIMVYDGSSGAQTPSSVSADTNNVFIDDDSVDVRTGSGIKASFGSITTIGPEDAAHAEIQSDSFTIYNGVPTECFSIESSATEVSSERQYPYTDSTSGITFTGAGTKTRTYTELKDVANKVSITAAHGGSLATATRVVTSNSQTFTFSFPKDSTGNTLRIKMTTIWNKSTGVLSITLPSDYIVSGKRKGIIRIRISKSWQTLVQPAPAMLFGELSGSIGGYSTAMGKSVSASGDYSHAEGYDVIVAGSYSHAEGRYTRASGNASHAEGDTTTASGSYGAHAEGGNTTASGSYSHAEGGNTTASGFASHAEGYYTTASENYAHAQNNHTTAGYSSQTAIGKYNNNLEANAFEIGNGDNTTPSNAFSVDWDGRISCGDYYGNFKSIFDVFYPVGSCYTTDTNTNPSTWLGGTWALVDKRFTPSNGENGITWNTTNTKTERTFAWIRNDHDLWLRFRWTNNVAFSDTEQAICTINMATLGFKSGESGYYQWITGACDGINAALLMNLSWSGSTGTVYIQDVITRAATVPTTTGQPAYATMLVKCDLSHMDDSACNQFMWKRTA